MSHVSCPCLWFFHSSQAGGRCFCDEGIKSVRHLLDITVIPNSKIVVFFLVSCNFPSLCHCCENLFLLSIVDVPIVCQCRQANEEGKKLFWLVNHWIFPKSIRSKSIGNCISFSVSPSAHGK